MDLKGKKIWVAGHSGMVGKALIRRLQSEDCDILTTPRPDIDYRNQKQVFDWVKAHKPHGVFIAAAKVGGILANMNYKADFIYDNLMIASNIIKASFEHQVEKLLFLGSSCIYPAKSPQPIKEEYLLSGPLEPTNEPYAIAKIAGVKLCQAFREQHQSDFISGMPSNLYGIGDNFHHENSHVMAALLARFHHAKTNHLDQVSLWGTGKVRREFLYVDDCADACIFLMKHYSDMSPINIGMGEDISIADLAGKISALVGFSGDIIFDASKPSGVARKLFSIDRAIQLGWRPRFSLDEGLELYYKWFLDNLGQLRKK